MRRRSDKGSAGLYRQVVDQREGTILDIYERLYTENPPPPKRWPEPEPIEVHAWQLPDWRERGLTVHDRVIVHPDDRWDVVEPAGHGQPHPRFVQRRAELS